MLNDDELLNQVMDRTPPPVRRGNDAQVPQPAGSTERSVSWGGTDFCQWQIGLNRTFRAAGKTTERLPVGVYLFGEDNVGLYISVVNIVSDELISLPDGHQERILSCMKKFWRMRDAYRDHGLLYKRGVLLWGPPGSGKTATLQLLCRELLAADGLVILVDNPRLASYGLQQLRVIEPERQLICVMEDIDEIIDRYGEHALLALLDGENQVDNIVNIATTNYPDRLGARIVNRPARFDERIFIGMPSPEARRTYLMRNALTADVDLERWVQDTDGLSIAHLRELAAAVLCLDQPYESVITRLRSMRIKMRNDHDPDRPSVPGFAN